MMQPIDYLSPDVPLELPWYELPIVIATPESLKGYGQLVDDYRNFPIEIVTWPAQGWRPIDVDTGNQGGTIAGNFDVWWEGDFLYGRNQAVNDQYLFGWSKNPGEAQKIPQEKLDRSCVLLWHTNYHPDSGQLFFPLNSSPFVVPLALAGDDVKPEDFKAFYFDGTQGLYIHPNIWHEGIFPLTPGASFYDCQGKVHARVSCNIAQEFGLFLSVPLKKWRC
ncbi:MAG: ureidoglycolate hydrolase [Okeania sp. SIO3H1]|nr:ureidoglycolate hydrolase [Okeania sp. SIO3H1]